MSNAGPLMQNWIKDIDPRALQGKTARKLQLQAEREMARRDQEARDQLQRMAKVVAKSGVIQEELQRANDRKGQELKRLQADLRETEEELEEARRPRRAAMYDGKGMELRFAPARSDSHSYYSHWTLEELESVLLHMRMAGATDKSVVVGRDSGLQVEIKDDGLPLQTWESPHRDVVAKPKFWWLQHKALAIGSAVMIFSAGLGLGSLL